MTIRRWSGRAPGRSNTVAYGDLIWTVANAIDTSADFEAQVHESLAVLDAHLQQAGSARTHLLSVQVILSNIQDWGAFDRVWQQWIGPHAEQWPQRACYQGALAAGLRLELVVVAAPASALQQAETRVTPHP